MYFKLPKWVSVLMLRWLMQSSISSFRGGLLSHFSEIAELISFGGSFQSDLLSGVLFACLGAPIPKSLRKMAEATNGTLLAKHWLNTPVLSLSCANIALFAETSVGSSSELGDVIMPPSPLLQWENGSLLLLQGLFKELAPWRSTHQPLWEWGVGVCVLFCIFPLGNVSS